MAYAIEFDRVSKQYRLGEARTSLREALAAAAGKLVARARPAARPFLWALRDVSFRVAEGQALGVIGPNGAGKTTALKLLTGITRPTQGQVRAGARISSLIELGAGFHPDLTGRENIHLNGAILGMTPRQIRARFEEIVAFSGLERFLDTPVKRYSSGMYARLGFSVAAHTGARILLIDEVLAVGDLGFQARCVQRMRELLRDGATIVFISHSLYYVSYFCNRAILLHEGKVLESGTPQQAIASYQDLMRSLPCESRTVEGVTECSAAASKARITDVRACRADGRPGDVFALGETLVLRIRCRAFELVESPVVRVSIFSSEGVRCFSSHNVMQRVRFPDVRGDFEVRIELPDLRLMPDSYSISVGLLESSALGPYDWKEFCAGFRVARPGRDNFTETGLIFLPQRWHFYSLGETAREPAGEAS